MAQRRQWQQMAFSLDELQSQMPLYVDASRAAANLSVGAGKNGKVKQSCAMDGLASATEVGVSGKRRRQRRRRQQQTVVVADEQGLAHSRSTSAYEVAKATSAPASAVSLSASEPRRVQLEPSSAPSPTPANDPQVDALLHFAPAPRRSAPACGEAVRFVPTRIASVLEEPELEESGQSGDEIGDAEAPVASTQTPTPPLATVGNLYHFDLNLLSETALRERPEMVKRAIGAFQDGNKLERRQIVAAVLPFFKDLALSQNACRLVQEVISEVVGPEQVSLLSVVEAHVQELYESPHGNHVLAKVIEVMPSGALGPIISQITGKATVMARHRFGCRVMERLLEHCSESQLGAILDEVVVSSDTLSMHQYGNFVVQHLFEHGSASRQRAVLQRVLPSLPQMAVHRSASHVVQRAIAYCDAIGQSMIFAALLTEKAILGMAINRYGGFVVEELAQVVKPQVHHLVRASFDSILANPNGRKTLEKLGLIEAADAADAGHINGPKDEAEHTATSDTRGEATESK
eukprot:TRINITY_DN614_c0_g6_i1.p1 TRINITY_DN614_c0_g6~~TRINITY_DN614_c0_g6_i1.p1  ORF type:complete len:519 (+),score=116.94 TRINITY_DN614_c0_g6_i1:59-1615(+)